MIFKSVKVQNFKCLAFFFFNDTATTKIYTLSLHDALPIYAMIRPPIIPTAHNVSPCPMTSLRTLPCVAPTATRIPISRVRWLTAYAITPARWESARSEEHTSELQSLTNLVCRLLLEKKTSQ